MQNNSVYDAMVIGAGPAGCAAAKILAERGRRVLLVEKFKLPRYKSCSGVLIKKSMELVERYFGERVPEEVTCAPSENRGMIFTDDHGKEYRFEQPGLNVWRNGFDNWLAQRAAECGAELRDNTSAVLLEEQPDRVVVTLRGERLYTESARYVIDCEGVVGAVKRKILGSEKDYIITFQTFNDGKIDLDPHYFYAYLQPEFSEYDAWFNVKDNKPVLGVSVKNAENIARFYAEFLEYMTKNHGLRIDAELRGERWLMPRIHPECAVNLGAGRILFAGEIAGLLNPMGEGISAALESGFLAANAVDEHFGAPEEIHAQYSAQTAELRAYMRRQWRFVGGISEKFGAFKNIF